LSRGFLHWRLSNAGPAALVHVASSVMGPASETRHIKRRAAGLAGTAEDPQKADGFAAAPKRRLPCATRRPVRGSSRANRDVLGRMALAIVPMLGPEPHHDTHWHHCRWISLPTGRLQTRRLQGHV